MSFLNIEQLHDFKLIYGGPSPQRGEQRQISPTQ